jgi:hypothetical protein
MRILIRLAKDFHDGFGGIVQELNNIRAGNVSGKKVVVLLK